jgi:cbb3-type cytochrome oxidase subunit 3
MLADSLQAAVDTVVVVDSQANTLLDWLSFIGTFFVAAFTGGYLYYTYWIYDETKKQAKSSQKAATAAQESNQIVKRAEFYPVFDFGAGLQTGVTRPIRGTPWIENQSENIAFDVSIFYLIWQPGGEIKKAKKGGQLSSSWLSPKHNVLAGRHSVGDVQSGGEWTGQFKTKFEIMWVQTLVRFSDALDNTYYRSKRYTTTGGALKPPGFEVSHTYTTGLTPHRRYTLSREEEGNILLVPENKDYDTIDNLVAEDIPTPIRKFNESARNSTAEFLFRD